MLNIVFLCISLEPGRDGVGDYVRRLGVELIRQGHTISAIALNDKYLINKWVGFQNVEGTEIPIYRVPAIWSSKRRFKTAEKWVEDINPQWLSLQYVPFGFHNKGLPFGLSKYLQRLGVGRNWHVMFHELWVGMAEEASLKLVFWGFLQRQLILRMVDTLNPDVVHTQTKVYQLYLEKYDISAEVLPLISNIPVINSKLSLNSSILESIDLTNEINFVVFGTVHPNTPFEEFISELIEVINNYNVAASFTFIGRWSVGQANWTEICTSRGIHAEVLGEQPPDRISSILSQASAGLVSTSYAVIEKSGSAAAMIAHGLNTLCIAPTWHPRGLNLGNIDHDNVTLYRYGQLETWLQTKRKKVNGFELAHLGELFSQSLSKKPHHQSV